MLGQSSSVGGDGTTSSQLPSDIPENRVMEIRPLGKLHRPSIKSAFVISSFSGQRYTLAEICMCTDYSCPTSGQIMMLSGINVISYGNFYMSDMGDLKCVKCARVRPYRLIALSTQ